MSNYQSLCSELGVSLNFINQMPGLFTVIGKDSQFRLANATALSWFGYKPLENIEGTYYYNFPCRVSEQHESFVEQDQVVFNSDKPLKILGRFCYSNDDWKVLFGQKYLLRNKDNEVSGVVAHFDDITTTGVFDLTRLFSSLDGINYQYNFKQQISYYIKSEYPNASLTKKEMECLFFILRGKTTKGVAQMLHLSPRTVESHFDNIKLKMGCINKSQVIEKSIFLGYMNIIPESLFG